MTEKLIKTFKTAAQRNGDAIDSADHKTANVAFEALHKSYLVLKDLDSLESLLPLLSDNSPRVRLWTARYLLENHTAQAESVLKELSKLKGNSAAFDARITLLEWKAGNLKF